MEREANYAAVGAFVLVVTLIGTLFVYWYSDTREHRDFNRYEIYFPGSVSGLEKGAAVRYLGVGVGRVQDMLIDPRDSSRVEVIVDVDTHTPISYGRTVAELGLQGVTGLLYIDLSDDPRAARNAIRVPQIKYPVILSAPSRFDVFLAGLPELVAAAGDLLNRASRLLSDENTKGISAAIAHLDQASAGLPRTIRDLQALIAELRSASTDLAATAHSAHGLLEAVTPDVRAATERLHAASENLVRATGQLDQAISENRADIRAFTRDGLPEIERFVREGRAAAHDIRELSNSLRENPAQLIYQPPQRGVEIPR
jgi:phospholipid/cholesterol/gamma-HCH transport system substrate-binding protein